MLQQFDPGNFGPGCCSFFVHLLLDDIDVILHLFMNKLNLVRAVK
ncbi:MAG: hypothetical protein ABIQ31_18805 [Ferruginibacter sp.]